MREVKKYTPAQRRAAIERCQMVGVPEASRDLGIGRWVLYEWQKNFCDGKHRHLFDENVAKPKRKRAWRGRVQSGSHSPISLALQQRIYRAARGAGMNAEEWFAQVTSRPEPIESKPIEVYKPKWWQVWR